MIEVDGDTHAIATSYNAARAAFIAREGYRVTRVAHADVTQNLDGVIEQISFSLEKEGTRCVSSGKDEGDRTQEKGGTA